MISGKIVLVVRSIGTSRINQDQAPPYSPDVTPADSWLFPKIGVSILEKSYEDWDNIVKAVQEQLDILMKGDFRKR